MTRYQIHRDGKPLAYHIYDSMTVAEITSMSLTNLYAQFPINGEAPKLTVHVIGDDHETEPVLGTDQQGVPGDGEEGRARRSGDGKLRS